MSALTHKELLKISRVIGVETSSLGHCAGIAAAGGVYFLQQQEVIYERISASVKHIYNSFSLASRSDASIYPSECRRLVEQISCLQHPVPVARRYGIPKASTVYQFSRRYFKELLPRVVPFTLVDSGSSIFFKDYFVSVTRLELELLLQQLSCHAQRNHVVGDLMVLFLSRDHALAVVLSKRAGEAWWVVDDEELKYQPYREVHRLVSRVFHSFGHEQHINLRMCVIVNEAEQQVLESVLAGWSKDHEITSLLYPSQSTIAARSKHKKKWFYPICELENFEFFYLIFNRSLDAGFYSCNPGNFFSNCTSRVIHDLNNNIFKVACILEKSKMFGVSVDLTCPLRYSVEIDDLRLTSYFASLSVRFKHLFFFHHYYVMKNAIENKKEHHLNVLLSNGLTTNETPAGSEPLANLAVRVNHVASLKLLLSYGICHPSISLLGLAKRCNSEDVLCFLRSRLDRSEVVISKRLHQLRLS